MKLDKELEDFFKGYNCAISEVKEYRVGKTKYIAKEEALGSIARRVPLDLRESYEYAEFLLKGANDFSVILIEQANSDHALCNLYRRNQIDADEFLELVKGEFEENEID